MPKKVPQTAKSTMSRTDRIKMMSLLLKYGVFEFIQNKQECFYIFVIYFEKRWTSQELNIQATNISGILEFQKGTLFLLF